MTEEWNKKHRFPKPKSNEKKSTNVWVLYELKAYLYGQIWNFVTYSCVCSIQIATNSAIERAKFHSEWNLEPKKKLPNQTSKSHFLSSILQALVPAAMAQVSAWHENDQILSFFCQTKPAWFWRALALV